MKNKGFTLIELLGVIIILALLMIIVFPSIVNSVKNSSNKTDDLTKTLIYNAADLFIENHINDFPKINNNKYIIELNTLVNEGLLTGPIKLSGSDNDITNNKCIQVTYNKGYKYELKEKGTCQKDLKCVLDDKDGDGEASLSDVITCGTESFYVMYNKDDEITMLSMYNLYVGNRDDVDLGVTPLKNPTGIQNSIAKGYGFDDPTFYGVVEFATSSYWVDKNNTLLSEYGNDYPTWVYDDNSNLYKYVNAYETYLKENGVSSAKATLMKFDQLMDLGCTLEGTGSCLGAPEWVSSTSYWTGSAFGPNSVWGVDTDGHFGGIFCDYGNYFGVRPVVTISVSEI